MTTRTQPDYYYRQSAVIPYRTRNGELEILTITSRKRKRWIAPKGVIEPFLSPSESAAKEAWEEAGILGVVHPQPLGAYVYFKWGDNCTVTVFAMQVQREMAQWPENYRRREWVSVDIAAARMEEDDLKQMIEGLPAWLQKQERDGC